MAQVNEGQRYQDRQDRPVQRVNSNRTPLDEVYQLARLPDIGAMRMVDDESAQHKEEFNAAVAESKPGQSAVK